MHMYDVSFSPRAKVKATPDFDVRHFCAYCASLSPAASAILLVHHTEIGNQSMPLILKEVMPCIYK